MVAAVVVAAAVTDILEVIELDQNNINNVCQTTSRLIVIEGTKQYIDIHDKTNNKRLSIQK